MACLNHGRDKTKCQALSLLTACVAADISVTLPEKYDTNLNTASSFESEKCRITGAAGGETQEERRLKLCR